MLPLIAKAIPLRVIGYAVGVVLILSAIAYSYYWTYNKGYKEAQQECRISLLEKENATKDAIRALENEINARAQAYLNEMKKNQQRYEDLKKRLYDISNTTPPSCSITPDRLQIVRESRSPDRTSVN